MIDKKQIAQGCYMRKFRYIDKNHGKDSLTKHEIKELDVDFGIDTEGFYVLTPVTLKEWKHITNCSTIQADSST